MIFVVILNNRIQLSRLSFRINNFSKMNCFRCSVIDNTNPMAHSREPFLRSSVWKKTEPYIYQWRNAHSALLEKLNSRNGDARNIENNDKCVLSLQFISNSSRSSRCFFAIPTTFKGGHGTQCHFEIACLTGHGNCREMHWEDQNARKVGKSDARAWRATHAL